MAGAFRIAEGYVEVTADESNYDRAMQRLRAKKNKATITLDIDDSAALAKLRRFADEHSRTVLKAVIDADLSDASIRRVQSKLDQLTKDRVVKIRADVDTRVAAAEIRNLTQRRTVRIGLDVDTRVAADSLANLTRRRTMTVQARADTADANASLRFLTRDRTVNVRARMLGSLAGLAGLGGSASSSAGGVGLLSSRVAMLASLIVGAIPTIAALGQSIAAMGPAASLAAPAILSLASAFAVIKLGTAGMGDAFKAAFAPATKSAGAAESATRKVENAQRSLAKAQQAVKDAEVAAAEARVRAARDIADAQQELKNTVQDVADANRRAAQSVADAERDLADAQRASRQAQEDLNDARQEAAEDLEDLNNRLVGAELDQRQRVLDLQDAEEELAAVKAKGATATQEDLDKAQLAYDKAVQALKEQQTETGRLQEDAAAANAAGVEGSEKVTGAKKDIADATRQITERTQTLRDAELEASRTQEDGAQRVARAQRDVADAQAAAAQAAKDGARQIADAQEAARVAAQALADAQTSGATATNKLGEAMAKLSPVAQQFVNAVLAQAGAWRALKLDVQDALFAGLGQKFTEMSTTIIPSLRDGLVGTANVLNLMARNAANAVIELAKTGQMRQLFASLNGGLAPLSKLPAQIITGLSQISIAAAPAFARLSSAVAETADRWSERISKGLASGSLEESINRAIDTAKQFKDLLSDIGGTFGNIMDAAAAGGGDALGSLGAMFAELRRITEMPEVQKALTSIFEAVHAVAKLVAGTLGAVIEAALPLLAALAPVVTELAEKFGPVLADLAAALGSALTPIIEALLPVVADIGDILVGLAQQLMPLLKPIGDLIGAVISALAPYLPAIGQSVSILVGALVSGLQPVMAALLPIVGMFGQLVAQLAPLFPPIMLALVPLIPPLSQLALSLANLAMQVLTPLIPLIVKLAQMFTTVLAGAIGILIPVITTIIGWITMFVDKISGAVEWVVDKFRWLYDVLVGHSIIPDLVKAIINWFTSLWTKTKEIFTGLKNWVVSTWNSLWNSVREKWNSFWSGLKNAVGSAWTAFKASITGLKNAITSTWNSLWNGARDKVSSIFSTVRSKISEFSSGMRSAFSNLKNALGSIWNGIKSTIGAPVKWVIKNVYGGIRSMWNTIAGKISSRLTLPAISLGFNKGGVVPGQGNSDTVPAMLTPGERILSNQQVAQLGGHRGIDAMLGRDKPTRTGGNPTRRQEKDRQQAGPQHFAEGGIVGSITSAIGSVASWAKNIVVGGLKAAAQKAISSMVRPLINQIPGGGVGSLMRGLSNKALDGMLGWFGKEDKKAAGGPAVQRALSWVKTQNGLPYQWGGNGNPSWDCSGLVSAVESVIRGERPHRRWATGSFSGSSGPSGWVRNLNSPFMIGITNSGVGHTAGTIGGVNIESRGGDGVVIGKRARSYKDSLFTSRWGFAPAAKFDSGGLLQPGATMAVNATGRPERILDPQQTALFEQLVRQGGTGGGVTIQAVNVSGTFDFSSPAEQKRAARQLVAAMKEELRQFDRGRI